MGPFSHQWNRKNERGQVTILFALALVLLLLFVGSAIDIGDLYVAKAKICKAVDASVLTGMRNLSLGQPKALTLASSAFTANYPTLPMDASPPSLAVSFGNDASNNLVINATGTATIRTYFIGILPQFATFTVRDSAQATRSKLVMSVVLDRSGSMKTNDGSTALPPAVDSFISDFDDSLDEVAMVSFASNATIDVPMATPFISNITNATNALSFGGGTFGVGGLTDGKAQNDSVPVAGGQNVTKVVVYFTDGLVNEIQTTLSCNGTPTVYNIGGYDSDSGNYVGFFNPTTGTQIYAYDGVGTWYTCNPGGNCSTKTTTSCLRNDAGFLSQQTGQVKSFTRLNVTNEATYQALQVANAMRAEGIFVYSIGLGTDPSTTFLQEIANDPSSPTYDPTQPQGLAVFAPSCPSTYCTAQLQQVFQTIASKILLRLSQ